MNFEAMPILRVEIDRLKHTINTMLGVHGSELGERLEVAVEKAVSAYDVDSKVATVVNESIDREIERYFNSGEGGKAIREFVKTSFEKPER